MHDPSDDAELLRTGPEIRTRFQADDECPHGWLPGEGSCSCWTTGAVTNHLAIAIANVQLGIVPEAA